MRPWMVGALGAGLGLLVGCGGDSSPQLEGAAAAGRAQFLDSNCASCHPGVGPRLEGEWGTTVTLADGSTVVFDAAWVEESVRRPDARVREGDWRRMPAYDERQLDADSLDDIVAYLEAVGPDSDP